MTTSIERHPPAPAIEAVIARFDETSDPHDLVVLADQLGAAGDRRAVRPLLERLGDGLVEQNVDVMDAMCEALIDLGVMCRCGNHSYSLRPRRILSAEIVETIHATSSAIPWQYFGRRRI